MIENNTEIEKKVTNRKKSDKKSASADVSRLFPCFPFVSVFSGTNWDARPELANKR